MKDESVGRRPALPSLFILAMATLALSACSGVPLQAFSTDRPATVSHPVSATSVVDARAPFRAIFCGLLQDRSEAPGDCESWLWRLADEVPALPLVKSLAPLRPRRIAFVPGIFGECIEKMVTPFSDAYPRLRALGIEVDVIHLAGRSSSAANADALKAQLETLRAQSHGPITLVAYSKGSADVLEMLVAHPETVPWIDVVVTIAGAISGSPIADKLGPLYDAVAADIPVPACPPGDGSGVQSLSRAHRLNWLAAHRLPLPIRFYSLAAITRRDDAAPILRGFHDWLSAVDPFNDGQMLASDAIVPGAQLLGFANADHWAVALQMRELAAPVRWFSRGRDFPRSTLIEAIVRFLDQDIAPSRAAWPLPSVSSTLLEEIG